MPRRWLPGSRRNARSDSVSPVRSSPRASTNFFVRGQISGTWRWRAMASRRCWARMADVPGAVVAAGTGSIGEALLADGAHVSSAAGDFRSATKAAAPGSACTPCGDAQHAIDGRAPTGAARARRSTPCDGQHADALLVWCERAGQHAYAALAPLVFETEASDPFARDLLRRPRARSTTSRRTLDPDGALPLVVSGSIGARLRAATCSRGCAHASSNRTATRSTARCADPARTGRTEIAMAAADQQATSSRRRASCAARSSHRTAASAASTANAVADERARATRRRSFVLPGFIDLHVHGGGGRDMMEGGDAVARDRAHARAARHDGLLATTMTAPLPKTSHARWRAIGAGLRARAPRAPRACSACISKARTSIPASSARSPTSRAPASMAEVLALHALAPIRADHAGARNRRATWTSIARSCARRRLPRADRPYARHATKTASPRSSAARAASPTCSTRCRGCTTARPAWSARRWRTRSTPRSFPTCCTCIRARSRAALRAIPRLFCVTDSTAAAGMPDGEYRLGRQRVTKCMGGVRLADGTLAGSTLTMDQALRNLVGARPDACATHRGACPRMPPTTSACADRGRLAPGCVRRPRRRSTATCSCNACIVEGEAIDLADA